MSYSEALPSASLRPWVDRIAATRDGAMPPPSPIRILPRSQNSLLLTWSSKGLRVEILGPRTRPEFVWDQEPADKIELCLRPDTAGRWFGNAPAEWVDGGTDLEEAWGTKIREALAPLEDVSPADRVRRVQAWLRAQSCGLGEAEPNDVDAAIARIHRSGGRLGIVALCDRVGLHQRTLERRFRARTGLSPKRYSRIVRFEKAVEALREGRPAAEVATHGFSDQAHLSRELRHFAGVPARELGLLGGLRPGRDPTKRRHTPARDPVGFLQDARGSVCHDPVMPNAIKLLSGEGLQRALDYLNTEGRPLDLAVARLGQGEDAMSDVLEALSGFQNSDGGFGRALEPDFRLPASSPMATMIGMDLLREVDAPKDGQMVARALQYLVETYDSELGGWQDIPPETNDHPHAPWWHHAPDRHYGPQGHWANPGGQITASFWRHADQVPASLLKEATAAGVAALEAEPTPLREYLAAGYDALAKECGDPQTAAKIQARVLRDAPEAVAKNEAQWKTDAFQPIWLVREADDPLAAPLRDTLEANLDFNLARQSEAGCWEPNWIWFDQPAENFAPAKRDWSSEQTALMLRILAGHRRLATGTRSPATQPTGQV